MKKSEFDQDTDRSNLEISIDAFSKPIEAVIPWIGGFFLAPEISQNRSCKTRLHDLSASTKLSIVKERKPDGIMPALASFGKLLNSFVLKKPYLKCRLYELKGSESFTVIETNTGLNDGIFPIGLLTKIMDCSSYSFRFKEHEPNKFHASLNVLKGVQMPRYVHVHEEGGWSFKQYGTPLEWESVDNYRAKYKKNRLNRSIMVEYLKRVGIDYGMYQQRKFLSVYEFSGKPGGVGLEAFHTEAMSLLNARSLGRAAI